MYQVDAIRMKLHPSDHDVAMSTEKSSNLSGNVVMIDFWLQQHFPADLAHPTLLFEKLLVILPPQPVLRVHDVPLDLLPVVLAPLPLPL